MRAALSISTATGTSPLVGWVRHGASITKSAEDRGENNFDGRPGDRNGDTHGGRADGIFSPTLDFLCVGGIGICALAAIALSPKELASYAYWPATILGLQILFNFPHFIASYRLLYQSKEIVYRYKWASIYLPIVLGSYLLFSLIHPVVFREPINDRYSQLADLISGMYLAAHYAGQTWGMVASFSYLGGVQIQKIERQLLRTVLLVFAGLARRDRQPPGAEIHTVRTRAEAVFGYAIRGHHAHRPRRDGGRDCGLRSNVPNQTTATALGVGPIPLYFGYLVFTRGYAGLLLLQVCHALQYLIFPLRVEINRCNIEESHAERNHIVLYVLALIAAGAFLFLTRRTSRQHLTVWCHDSFGPHQYSSLFHRWLCLENQHARGQEGFLAATSASRQPIRI